MTASKQNVLRIALPFLILFLTASCGLLKTDERTAGQAQGTNETVPEATSVPIDTSLDQDIRTRYLEEKVNRLENRVSLLEKKSCSHPQPSPSPKQPYPASPAKPNQPAPSAQTGDLDPVTLYKKGRALFIEHDISMAQTLFSDFMKNFP
ncbi:MAG: tol-pal system protein YbgF, partial [Desulfobacter postgatei]|nr:tol-pal system protein YbgF [Desulfobacter postgatei]